MSSATAFQYLPAPVIEVTQSLNLAAQIIDRKLMKSVLAKMQSGIAMLPPHQRSLNGQQSLAQSVTATRFLINVLRTINLVAQICIMNYLLKNQMSAFPDAFVLQDL